MSPVRPLELKYLVDRIGSDYLVSIKLIKFGLEV